jgi:hypothetical protein
MRPTQLNQHTVKSDRNKDTHAHYTNLKQHSDHTDPPANNEPFGMTRLRDVLSQNPNRVRHHEPTRGNAMPRMVFIQRAVDTPFKTFSPYTPEQ